MLEAFYLILTNLENTNQTKADVARMIHFFLFWAKIKLIGILICLGKILFHSKITFAANTVALQGLSSLRKLVLNPKMEAFTLINDSSLNNSIWNVSQHKIYGRF